MSPPPRIVAAWSNLPDIMDDFPWRWLGCGDASGGGGATDLTATLDCAHAPVPLLPCPTMSAAAGGDPLPATRVPSFLEL
jgi:hypothetical protein